MESRKHNDELIKRKLADVDVEPVKLNFAKLNTAYQVSRTSSDRRRWLLWLFIVLGGAALFTTAYFILPSDSKTVTENKIPTAQSEKNTSTEIKKEETENPNSSNLETNLKAKEQNTVAQTKETEDQTSHSSSSNKETKVESTTKESTPLAESKTNATVTKTTKNTQGRSLTPISSQEKQEGKKSEDPQEVKEKQSEKKEGANTESKETPKIPKAVSNSIKENKTLSASGATGKSTNTDQTKEEKKSIAKEGNSVPEQSLSLGASKEEKKNETDPKILNAAVPTQNANEETKSKPEEKIPDPILALSDTSLTKNEEPAKNPIKKETAQELKKAEEVKSAIDDVPKTKNSLFSISVEGSFLMMNNKTRPGLLSSADANFKDQFSDAHASNKYTLSNGAVLLGYTFKKMGIKAGVSYFDVKSSVDLNGLSSKKTQTVVDHYLYDSSNVIIDTVFTTLTKNIVIVNGDTISPTTYENSARFVSIPVQLSWQIPVFKRMTLEPMLGIVYGYKLRSQELSAQNNNTFEYGQGSMKKMTLLADAGVRVSYSLTKFMSLYLSQNFGFGTRSMYKTDYVISRKVNMGRSSVGLTFYLK